MALAVHELSALAGSEGVPYSASQIVHAFNAWKAAVGRKYSNPHPNPKPNTKPKPNPNPKPKPNPTPTPNQVGRKYSNLDGEALELRAFAGTPTLASYHP